MNAARLRAGPWAAAAVAAAAALPGLRLPFLSDDWLLIQAADAGRLAATPFHDFRPLYMLTYWIDLRVWGFDPRGFHLTNLILIAVAAALVVLVLERWTGEPGIAAAAGVLFALHPYHVENAAWAAARSDPLVAVFFLLAILAFEGWLTSSRRLPIGVLVLAEAALLSKETAISLPLVLAIRAIIVADPAQRRRALRRGFLPVLLLTALHFTILRPWVLGGLGRTLVTGAGIGWARNALGQAVAAVIPLDAERLAARPVLWGSLAIGVWMVLALAARVRSGRLPPAVPVAVGGLAVLGMPYVVGFQERYLFLPSAAAAFAIVTLAFAGGRIFCRVALVVIAGGWIGCGVEQWRDWGEAATASRRLIGDLIAAADSPGVEEIVVANLPFRVRGGSVAGDFGAALACHGSRPVPVRVATWISYPSADAPALAGPPEAPVPAGPPEASAPGGAEGRTLPHGAAEVGVRLRIEETLFSHWVGPPLPSVGGGAGTWVASLVVEQPGVVRVGLQPRPGRALYAWDRGHLVPLEVDSCPTGRDRPESPHAR